MLAPDNVEAHLVLAQAYEKTDRVEDAIRAYRRTLSLNPSHPGARSNLQTLLQNRTSR